ncbi:alkyl sulfatase dimerization domain-containing protein [Phenylobacterium sp. SCN 70-31]|mgnify:CR=1 FL=1|uniref:alkyl/aryl-sulfatase n=1 Tax=Phenylobacterium sp. SCN 70-31 TaxID=1660129 RepID=UPI00086A3BB5|nr:alkyl sulfatase dimerization domain-containing protein [Phenylobacterium sp. SCN 70-31]ODT88782.1 MAG: alkyl sulfatase [Phenylobacterium sp. SCN 70-31]
MRLFAGAVLAAVLAPVSAAAPALAAGPDFADHRDFDFADRGFVGTRTDPKITAADGRVVWDLSAFDFLKGPAPASVNPSLWRQSQLLARHGLFEVTPGVWQVRGFDLANATFIAGKTGWIVIDPLTSAEAARAALDLANAKLGARPVVALIYTHSHADHFAGARGMVAQADVDSRKVQVIAPEGFLEHAVSENVIAGPAMGRRATYQFGSFLPKGPQGLVNAGIGPGLSAGTQTLIPPTVDITRTGQALTIDGVRLEFQLTPGTEAPAEMNIWLPDLKALCLAENANATLHNVLTPRGALVRDASQWAAYLGESLRLYGDSAEVLFTSHAWPRFGREVIADYIEKHRDAYKYLHDQTVRLMNDGLTGPEIANRIRLPEVLDREWYNRGYYGTMSFNSRAVYQRYMGWYDANPVNLAPLDPADAGARYVAMMGGRDAVLAAARTAHQAGDDRWAGELANRLVMADAGDTAAKALLASVYERQAIGAESAIWRNMYLSGAQELRDGVRAAAPQSASLDYIRNTPTPMLLDLFAVRLDPDKAGASSVAVDLVFPDRKERFRVRVKHSVLTYEADPAAGTADAVYTLPRAQFLAGALGGADLSKAATSGDPAALGRLLSWLTPPRAGFPIVTR